MNTQRATNKNVPTANFFEIDFDKFRTFLFRTLLLSHFFMPLRKVSVVHILSTKFTGCSTDLLHTATVNYGYLKCCFYDDLRIKLFAHILVAENFWKFFA